MNLQPNSARLIGSSLHKEPTVEIPAEMAVIPETMAAVPAAAHQAPVAALAIMLLFPKMVQMAMVQQTMEPLGIPSRPMEISRH